MNLKVVVIYRYIMHNGLLVCSALFTYILLHQVECFDIRQCGTEKDCLSGECCASETILDTTQPSTRVQWRCKALGNYGEVCNSFSNQYCRCTSGYRCKAAGTWFFGNGYCVTING